MQYERNLKFYCLLGYSDESSNHTIRLKDLTILSGPNGSSWKLLLLIRRPIKLKDKLSAFHTTNGQWFYDLSPRDTAIYKGKKLEVYSTSL